MDKSLTFFMPAYLEVKNLSGAVEETNDAILKAGISDYEILIITSSRLDGTDDGTRELAIKLASGDSHIRAIHGSFVSLGDKYHCAINHAQKKYMIFVPGDNETVKSSLIDILSHIGEADMIIPYQANPSARPLIRRFFSSLFVVICNILYGLHLKYYNGTCVHRVDLLRKMNLGSKGFAYMVEILVPLLKSGKSYIEVPMEVKVQPGRASAAFKLKNVYSIFETLWLLFVNIRIGGNLQKYFKKNI